LGYSIHLVIHPVMRVERDKNNTLKNVFLQTPEGTNGNYESFIHCEILEASSPEKLKILEEEVARALDDVRVSVEDWMPIRKRLQTVIKTLKAHPPHISKEELEETI